MNAPKPIHALNIALALLLAWACYGMFAPAPPAPPGSAKRGKAAEAEAAAGPEKGRSPRTHYNVIEEANIFKNRDVVVRPPEPTPAPTPTVPLPPLELELKGTTDSAIGRNLKAVILNKRTRKTETYGIGDAIPDTGGAKIVSITRNKIVLDRQGQPETLDNYPPDVSQLQGGTGTRQLKR